MVAPNLKESTSTLVDSGNPPTRFDGPGLNHLVKVIKGTHPTDKIQIKNVEPLARFSQYFDWLIYSFGTPLQPDYGIGVVNLKTGIQELTTTELRFATLHVFSSVTHTPPAESFPVLRIAMLGTLDCITRGNYISRSCIIDGLGRTLVRRAADFTNDSSTVFQITNSNVTIRNLTVEDIIAGNTAILRTGDGSNAIRCGPAAPGLEGVTLENIIMKDFVQHCLSFSATVPRYMKNIRFTNLYYDTTHPGADDDNGGSISTIRLGTTHAYLEHCVHIDSGHSSQDLSGVNPHVVYVGNYHSKNIGTGGCIASVSVAEREEDWGESEEHPIHDNYFYSDYFDIAETETHGGSTQSGVRVHGDSRKCVVSNNFISGHGESGVTVKSFNVFRAVGPPGSETGAPFDVFSDEVITTNNIIWRTYGSGVLFTLAPLSSTEPKVITKPCNSCSVIGNEIWPIKGGQGVNFNSDVKFCLIVNNQIYHVNNRNADDGAGIQMRINCPDNIVFGNHIMQPSANLTNFDHNIYQQQQGGISPTDRTYVLDNHLVSGKPLTLMGSDNFVNGNTGYRTEAWDTATVASGSTASAAITHGLSYTPTAKDIIIRPAGNVGNATQYRATSIGASTFVITVNASPGVTATFAWRIKRNG